MWACAGRKSAGRAPRSPLLVRSRHNRPVTGISCRSSIWSDVLPGGTALRLLARYSTHLIALAAVPLLLLTRWAIAGQVWGVRVDVLYWEEAGHGFVPLPFALLSVAAAVVIVAGFLVQAKRAWHHRWFWLGVALLGMLPAVGMQSSPSRAEMAAAARAGTRLVAAIERYRDHEGRYPESLAHLQGWGGTSLPPASAQLATGNTIRPAARRPNPPLVHTLPATATVTCSTWTSFPRACWYIDRAGVMAHSPVANYPPDGSVPPWIEARKVGSPPGHQRRPPPVALGLPPTPPTVASPAPKTSPWAGGEPGRA